MRNLFVGLGMLAALTGACALPAPIPATPQGGGSMPLATQPPRAGAVSGAPTVDGGKTLFVSKGCIACHVTKEVPGAVGTIGPPLDGLVSRATIAGGVLPYSEGSLRRWLQNPPAVKPGTQMPNLGLSALEIDNLIAFLVTLK